MKTNKLSLIAFLLGLVLVQSCKKNTDDLDKPILNLGGEVFPETEMDRYAKEVFLPYNIRVIYRWDQSAIPGDKKVTPINEDKVIPVLKMIKENWLDLYNLNAPSPDFMKINNFRQLILVGSSSLNNNNTETLATAEGGLNITYYKMNEFDPNDMIKANNVVHTIHHEFTHILNQRKKYVKEWGTITKGYDNAWTNKAPDERLQKGFISAYASSSDGEDFAESTAIMLAAGKRAMDKAYTLLDPAAATALKKKEVIIVDYFKNEYGIDFYALQKSVNADLKKRFPAVQTEENRLVRSGYGVGSVVDFFQSTGIYLK